MGEAVLEPVRKAFRAFARTVCPETAGLDEPGWTALEAVIENLLATKPAKMRRQVRLLIRALNGMPVLRYGRRFVKLDPARATSFLNAVQGSSIKLLRIGFWGLRTMIFMGYYGRPEIAESIGYRADRRGWEALG